MCLLNTKTGDKVVVHKGFLHEMFLHEADGQDDDDDEDENKYSFLAKDLQMGAGNTDFSDPAALLRR